MSDSGMSTPLGSSSAPAGPHKDRHEPRGRKPNDHLPPSRAREVQRAFRLRRAEHLASLEERINALEAENSQLRRLLNIPEADRPKIGTGPTGRGKSLREGGVPMSERVRARREAARAREKQNKELGLPSDPNDKADMELASDHDLDGDGGDEHEGGGGGGSRRTARDTSTFSPKHNGVPSLPPLPQNPGLPLPLFQNPPDGQYNYQLPLPFDGPLSPDNPFNDFESAIFKPSAGGTPNFSNMFNLYEEPPQPHPHQLPPMPRQHSHDTHLHHHDSHSHSHPLGGPSHSSPLSPPVTSHTSHNSHISHTTAAQPELLTRLKQCCHLSDSHVVNDPGLLIFATRLCQSFPCSFGGAHPDSLTALSDSDYLLLDDSWRALRNQLDPGTDNDGENRINTGRMAAELVIRAAHSRGQGQWILCRYREGMSIKRSLVGGLVNGLGGNFE